mmetsp:Transcript_2968/g.7036  ORF Transcript_2968/g.7036 Transcript_2968/m.7036 type:complete len:326 (-) Transcript_2968:92-1069(-)
MGVQASRSSSQTSTGMPGLPSAAAASLMPPRTWLSSSSLFSASSCFHTPGTNSRQSWGDRCWISSTVRCAASSMVPTSPSRAPRSSTCFRKSGSMAVRCPWSTMIFSIAAAFAAALDLPVALASASWVWSSPSSQEVQRHLTVASNPPSTAVRSTSGWIFSRWTRMLWRSMTWFPLTLEPTAAVFFRVVAWVEASGTLVVRCSSWGRSSSHKLAIHARWDSAKLSPSPRAVTLTFPESRFTENDTEWTKTPSSLGSSWISTSAARERWSWFTAHWAVYGLVAGSVSGTCKVCRIIERQASFLASFLERPIPSARITPRPFSLVLH